MHDFRKVSSFQAGLCDTSSFQLLSYQLRKPPTICANDASLMDLHMACTHVSKANEAHMFTVVVQLNASADVGKLFSLVHPTLQDSASHVTML